MSDDGYLKKVEMELTMSRVDTELIQLAFGGYGTDGVQHGLTVYAPIKRTFWQWLRRKPIQQRVTHFPNVTFVIDKDNDGN